MRYLHVRETVLFFFPSKIVPSTFGKKIFLSRKFPGNLSQVRKVVMCYSLAAAKPVMRACSGNCILISDAELICKSIVVHCYLVPAENLWRAKGSPLLYQGDACLLLHPVIRGVCEEETPAVWFCDLCMSCHE